MTGMDKLKAKLAKDELCIGTHVKWCDSSISESLSIGGFDYMWIDGEHGTLSLVDVQNHIRAAQANGAAAFCRVAWNDPVLAKPILEMGPDGIIFPFVKTADEAREAVAACRYPPHGVRGFCPGRAIKHGHMPFNKYLEAAEDVWVIVQIEHIDAVRNLDSILEVEGVDAFIVGQSDLSASMGIMCQLDNPRLLEVLGSLCEKLSASGRPFGTATGYDPEVVKRWMDWGGQLISVGGEEEFICRQTQIVLEGMNGLFAESKKERPCPRP